MTNSDSPSDGLYESLVAMIERELKTAQKRHICEITFRFGGIITVHQAHDLTRSLSAHFRARAGSVSVRRVQPVGTTPMVEARATFHVNHSPLATEGDQ